MTPTHQDFSDGSVRLASSRLSFLPRRGMRMAGLAALLLWAGVQVAFFGDIPRAWWLPGLALCLSALAAIARLMPLHYPHATFGACNTVTLFRGTLALALVTPLLAGMPPNWSVFAIALFAASLDGVDGRLARRSGLTSGFGARFDMETDSLLALVLALHALSNGLAWPVALVLGASRYVFLGAMAFAPWLRRPLPERFSRKAVCAVQLSALVALLAPPLAGSSAAMPVAGAAAFAVLVSFARDVLWLCERRK